MRIILSNQKWNVEKLLLELTRDYIGGAGFDIKYLYDKVKLGTEALSPEDKLIFAPGPFTGTNRPCASRMEVAAKSTLTNVVGLSLPERYFPTELKFTVYGAVVVEERAEKPMYIWLKNEEV